MFQKYLKYKKKYLDLKKQIGGARHAYYKYQKGNEVKYCIVNTETEKVNKADGYKILTCDKNNFCALESADINEAHLCKDVKKQEKVEQIQERDVNSKQKENWIKGIKLIRNKIIKKKNSGDLVEELMDYYVKAVIDLENLEDNEWVNNVMYYNRDSLFQADLVILTGSVSVARTPDKDYVKDDNDIKFRFNFEREQTLIALPIILKHLLYFSKENDCIIFSKISITYNDSSNQCGKIFNFYFSDVRVINNFITYAHNIISDLVKNGVKKDECFLPTLQLFENDIANYEYRLNEGSSPKLINDFFIKNLRRKKFEYIVPIIGKNQPMLTFRCDDIALSFSNMFSEEPIPVEQNDKKKQFIIENFKGKTLSEIFTKRIKGLKDIEDKHIKKKLELFLQTNLKDIIPLP